MSTLRPIWAAFGLAVVGSLAVATGASFGHQPAAPPYGGNQGDPNGIVQQSFFDDEGLAPIPQGDYGSAQADNDHIVYGNPDGFGLAPAPGRVWGRVDYLLWWTRSARLPALATTSAPGDFGILGRDSTEVLFGDGTVHSDARHDFRVALGYWSDPCRQRGFEGDYFSLNETSASFFRQSPSSEVLARPFFDVLAGEQASQLIAHPEVEFFLPGQPEPFDAALAGSIDIRDRDYFQSAGLRYRTNLLSRTEPWMDIYGPRRARLDMIAGYRYYRLDTDLGISEVINVVDDLAAGHRFEVSDHFSTKNDFHGAELGLVAEVSRGRWTWEFLAKMALGNNRQVANIHGTTQIYHHDVLEHEYDSGLLAIEGANAGSHRRNYFVVIPQFGVDLGYDLTSNTRLHVGYNFLYWAQVLQAGRQVDTNINPNLLPPQENPVGPTRPRFEFVNSNYWAQGLNLGVDVRF